MRYPEFWIRKLRGLPHVKRSVLDKMTRFAGNSETGDKWICNPFIGTIADELELDRRFVERAIDWLNKHLFISSSPNYLNKKQRANTYELHVSRRHPPSIKSERILEAIKAEARNLMGEDEFNEWWRDMKYGWYNEKRHIFWLWAESKKHEEKISKHVRALDDFLKAKFGTVKRKLPKNAKRAKPEIPLIQIKIVGFYLKKSD